MNLPTMTGSVARGAVVPSTNHLEGASPTVRAPRRWLAPVGASVMSLLSSSACVLAVWQMMPAGASLTSILMPWDAAWYKQIATYGYSWNPQLPVGKYQSPNFFPVYPLLLHVLHVVTRLSVDAVAIGSSILFQALSAALLVVMARRRGASDRDALLWVTLFVLSPPVVFDILGYYSALFCVLCFLALLFADQGRRWPAALAVGVASGTNPLGIGFAVAFVVWVLVDVVSTRRLSWRSFATTGGQAAACVCGIVGYALYDRARFGDALAFYHATAAWEPRIPLSRLLERVVTFVPLRASFTLFFTQPYTPNGLGISSLVDAFAALVVVALIARLLVASGAWRTLGFWLILVAFLVVQAGSSAWNAGPREASTTRFLLPIAFGVAALAPGSRLLTRPVPFVIALVVLVAGTVLFLHSTANGYWID
jgi:hypothetical protein